MTRSIPGGKLHATRNMLKLRTRAKASANPANRLRAPAAAQPAGRGRKGKA